MDAADQKTNPIEDYLTAGKKPLISVIVPVHNAEKTIIQCVESILQQTYSNLEVLLVNNASTDHSLARCMDMAEKDARVRVFSLAKAGVSLARNKGLEEASGEFFGFVDADDYLRPDMYEQLMSVSLKQRAEIVFCEYYSVSADGTNPQWVKIDACGEGVVNVALSSIFDSPSFFVGGIWAGLYLRERFGKFRFDERLRFAEDSIWLMDCFHSANRVWLTKQPLYFYRRPESFLKKYYSDDIYQQWAWIGQEGAKRYRSAGRNDYADIFLFYSYYNMIQSTVSGASQDAFESCKRWRKELNTKTGYRGFCKYYGLTLGGPKSAKGRAFAQICAFLVYHNMIGLCRLVSKLLHR